MDTLDLRDAMLVGFSMGCGEVVRYLSRHGDARVAGAVLIGTTTPCLMQRADNTAGVPASVFESFRHDWLMRDFPGWVDANMEPFVTPETPQGMRDWVRAELRDIRIPTLLVHGAQDATSPPALTAEPSLTLQPRGRLSLHEDAPPGLFIRHRDRLNAELRAFAAGI
jgi:pimeloyl-ACP methyl ester carboxylesterase